MYNSEPPSPDDLPTSRQLIRSTLIALLLATAILLTIVLPAEYGIDPTGIGSAIGLTEMGEIRRQLADEAARDADVDHTPDDQQRADADDQQTNPVATPLPSLTTAPQPSRTGSRDGGEWRDVFSLALEPAAGDDIKLLMQTGQTVDYRWTVDQGHLNSDLHTDDGPEGRSHSYRRGRAETEVSGTFTAASDGVHGWFWRNRSGIPVTVTLRVRGDYLERSAEPPPSSRG